MSIDELTAGELMALARERGERERAEREQAEAARAAGLAQAGKYDALPDLLTLKQGGEVINASGRTVCRLVESGAVRGLKVGRVWRVNKASLLRYAGLAE